MKTDDEKRGDCHESSEIEWSRRFRMKFEVQTTRTVDSWAGGGRERKINDGS